MPVIRTIIQLYRRDPLGARKSAPQVPKESQPMVPVLLSHQSIEILPDEDDENAEDTEDDATAEDAEQHLPAATPEPTSSVIEDIPASNLHLTRSRDKALSRLHKMYTLSNERFAATRRKLKIMEERLEKCIEPELLEVLLTCPICREFFDRPLVLSNCGHSFCLRCIFQGWLQQQETQMKKYSFLAPKCMVDFSCPTCEEIVTKRPVPNWQIRSMVDGLQSAGVLPSTSAVTEEMSNMDDIHDLLTTGSLSYD